MKHGLNAIKGKQDFQPTHGLFVNKHRNIHPVYRAWVAIKTRCYNPNYGSYHNYGGRGIKVCDRWLNSFENFRVDMLSTWNQGLQLDRIDVNGNYEPGNCRWATVSENAKNRRNKSIKQSIIPGVSYSERNKKWTVTIRFRNQLDAENFANEIQEKLNGITYL